MRYFSPIPTMTADAVRVMSAMNPPGGYNLIDVRQPHEYESGHIPGAVLIPLSALNERLGLFDKNKPAIAYCASGNRSASAAAILISAGFTEAYSLEGGIKAWLREKGAIASGAPEAGMAYFPGDSTIGELIALCSLLESGTAKLYAELSATAGDEHASKLFDALAEVETNHNSALMSLYAESTGDKPGAGFPRSILKNSAPNDEIVEGGIKLKDALDWAKGKPINDILDLCMALEANAYDLYIKMLRKADSPSSKKVFEMLCREENEHLNRLAGMMEAGMGGR